MPETSLVGQIVAKEWFSVADLAAFLLPDLPLTEKSLDNHIRTRRWRDDVTRARQVRGATKPVWQYHISLLPQSAQTRLALVLAQTSVSDWEAANARRNQLWARFERLPNEHRQICKTRLNVLERVETLAAQSGVSRVAAIAIATIDAGVQKSAYYEWRKMTDGFDREDWLAALAPSFSPAVDGLPAETAACHPDAWSFLKSD